MIFSSLGFMFRFLPIFILIYYLTPAKFRNYVLLIGSFIFYAIGEPFYIVLLMLSVGLNFFIGSKIQEANLASAVGETSRQSKKWFGISLLYNLGILGIFKYLDFIIENLNRLFIVLADPDAEFILQLPFANLLLPLGISFFTFELVAYQIRLYRKQIKAEKSLITFATYSFMFPQLLSGPIVLYENIITDIHHRKYSWMMVEDGLKLFVLGLGSKVLIANRLSSLWTEIQTIGFASISMPLAWMGAFSYALQIYFDFAGYSLMAIGVGKMLGFELPQNFNQPYAAKSVTEFWRRWHMTLTGWFREFIYIPLGGNRGGFFKTLRNMLAVWLVTGLWHGADWNFVIWGLSIFFLIVIEKLFLKRFLDKSRIFSRLYIIFVVPFTWILFAISDLSDLSIYVRRLVSFQNTNTYENIMLNDFVYYGKLYGTLFILAFIMATPFPARIYQKIKGNIFGIVLLLAIFWMSVYQLSISQNNPFMYFRF